MRYGSDRDDDPGDEPSRRGRSASGRRRKRRPSNSGRGRQAQAGANRSGFRGVTARVHFGWRRFRAKSWLAQIGYTTVVLSAALIVVVSVSAFAIYHTLDGNITRLNVGDLTGKTVYGELNILVLGSQERTGQTGFNFGYEQFPGTENSDNLLLIHLDKTHTHATVLSIPRDLEVYEPACKARSYVGGGVMGPYTYPPGALIDGALNIGGPTCAVETIQDLTGIKLDHVVVFDFNSFRTMVDALGGVDVCVPPGPGYHDPYSHLNLSPGVHRVTYNAALEYVRTRHGVGTGTDVGGDLPRIQLQQAFISSVVQQVNHEGLLSNLGALLKIANIATKALAVDQNLGSPLEMVHLAESLARLKARNVNLITVPTAHDTFPGTTSHLMAVQPEDDVLYEMVRTGANWHGSLPLEAYSRVKVEVLNGNGTTGLAGRTAAALKKLGFDVTGIGDAPYTPSTTVEYAGLEQADSAYTLMTALKGYTFSQYPAGEDTIAEPTSLVGSPGTVILVLGGDFQGVDQPPVAAPRPSPSASNGAKKGDKAKGSGSTGSGGSTVAASASTGPNEVQSRNAGASICSGLPPAYNPG
jgi:LCP family protein required for cell wall assembly